MRWYTKKKSRRAQRRGQGYFDYLILTGVILGVVIPFFVVFGGNIDKMRVEKIADAGATLNAGVNELLQLGVGSGKVVIFDLPSGILKSTVVGSNIILKFKGKDLILEFPKPIDPNSKFPIEEGRHHLKIYNKGDYIVIFECGNNQQEVYEQCDGNNNVCTDGSVAPTGTCITAGLEDECKCACTTNAQCPAGTKCVGGVCEPSPECGDNIIQNGEQCDDGNTNAGDGCSDICANEFCGDTVVQASLGEQCDGAPAGVGCSACLADCTCVGGGAASCGDGNIDFAAGEECDYVPSVSNPDPSAICVASHGTSSTCSAACLCTPCTASNQCTYPSKVCSIPTAGGTGQCADCNTAAADLQCLPVDVCMLGDCVTPVCGNGIKEGTEECDDNNLIAGDGCSPTCTFESASCNDITNYWTMDENVGLKAWDWKQKQYLSFTNAPWTGGTEGSAILFDTAHKSLVGISNAPVEGTLELMVKPSVWSTKNYIMNDYTNPGKFSIRQDAGQFVLEVETGGFYNSIKIPLAEVPTNLWTHIAVTWQNTIFLTKKFTLYVDGVYKGEMTWLSAFPANWVLGGSYANYLPDMYTGAIDDLGIFNVVLDAATILDHSNKLRSGQLYCSAAPVCGNGLQEPGEACDDGNANDADGCTTSCTICGNSVVEGSEQCDGTNLNGLTCLAYTNGFGSPAGLQCTSACVLNPSNCALPECMDGFDNDGDGLVDWGVASGVNDNCCAWPTDDDESLCNGFCGNGVQEGTEACDMNSFCSSVGLICGPGVDCNLVSEICTNNCQCIPSGSISYCGDGILQTGEQCENGVGCPLIGGPGTQAFCINCGCFYYTPTSNGDPSPGDNPGGGAACGNGVIDAGEQCEGPGLCNAGSAANPNAGQCSNCQCAPLTGQCATQSFNGVTLTCDSNACVTVSGGQGICDAACNCNPKVPKGGL